jgi:hypothetical protein
VSQTNAVSIPPTAIRIEVILREYFTKAPELAIPSEKTVIIQLSFCDDDGVISQKLSTAHEAKTKPNAAMPRAIGIRQRRFAGRSRFDRNSTVPAMQKTSSGNNNTNSGDHTIIC